MNTPRKYRKKPVVIEAVQYRDWERSSAAIIDWIGPRVEDDPYDRGGFIPASDQWVNPPAGVTALVWDTLHDTWVGVKEGHWIIKGIQGEFYPCDPEVFAETYAEADSGWPDPRPERCDPASGLHTTPHVGCILR